MVGNWAPGAKCLIDAIALGSPSARLPRSRTVPVAAVAMEEQRPSAKSSPVILCQEIIRKRTSNGIPIVG